MDAFNKLGTKVTQFASININPIHKLQSRQKLNKFFFYKYSQLYIKLSGSSSFFKYDNGNQN